jgi:hypothetical protein
VQVPEQIVVERGAHPDEPFAVIDQQPDIQFDAGQLGHRQPLHALAQRRARDGERVDAVRLAAITAGATLSGHQPRRHADDPLAVDEQEPLKRARDVAAVLQRPDPFVAQAGGPIERRGEPAVTNLDRLVVEQLAGTRADGGEGVRALVQVRAEHDHGLRPFHPI